MQPSEMQYKMESQPNALLKTWNAHQKASIGAHPADGDENSYARCAFTSSACCYRITNQTLENNEAKLHLNRLQSVRRQLEKNEKEMKLSLLAIKFYS